MTLLMASEAAVISECGRYRYVLRRAWAVGEPLVFVMLNPSTADALLDDPTIRRCIGFAKREGASGLSVVNLYAYRSTDPRRLWTVGDPVGPNNDDTLLLECVGRKVVCAWGANARADRVGDVRTLLQLCGADAWCLGTTNTGAPRHPLYIKADQPLQRYGANA